MKWGELLEKSPALNPKREKRASERFELARDILDRWRLVRFVPNLRLSIRQNVLARKAR